MKLRFLKASKMLALVTGFCVTVYHIKAQTTTGKYFYKKTGM